MNDKTVKIAAQLYEARDTMKRLLGDRYAERCQLWVDSINRVMCRQGCDELAAALAVAKEIESQGAGTAMLFAAVVEMIEGMFAMPAVGATFRYRSTHPAYPDRVAEGKATVIQHLTAANAKAPHMRPPERMLFVRGCDGGPMHGQTFLVKCSEVVRS